MHVESVFTVNKKPIRGRNNSGYMNSSLSLVPNFFKIDRSIHRNLAWHEIAAIFFSSEIIAKIFERFWLDEFAGAKLIINNERFY